VTLAKGISRRNTSGRAVVPRLFLPIHVTKSRMRRDPDGTPGIFCVPKQPTWPAYTGPDLGFLWSGRRDSNPRPPPWQGSWAALPTCGDGAICPLSSAFSFPCDPAVSRRFSVVDGIPTGPSNRPHRKDSPTAPVDARGPDPTPIARADPTPIAGTPRRLAAASSTGLDGSHHVTLQAKMLRLQRRLRVHWCFGFRRISPASESESIGLLD
jgi:hypothetical protein